MRQFEVIYNRGIATGFAQLFEKLARVVVDNTQPNLKTGGETSTYIVTW
ncbi:MAG TPA: hypothetical protein VF989_07920 [Polyangiaceae bacterium]|jgi:hypothetical protein